MLLYIEMSLVRHCEVPYCRAEGSRFFLSVRFFLFNSPSSPCACLLHSAFESMIDLTNSQDEVTCVDDDDAALPPKVDNAGPVQQRAAKPRAVDDPGEEFRGDGTIELCQTVGAVHKFFLIQLRGSSVTTTFGRVVDGTKQGRPNEPEAFASRSEALAHANTILSRTLGAGYRLAAGGGAAFEYVELPKADGSPPTKRPRKGGDTGGSTKQPKAAKAKAAAASGDGVSGRPDVRRSLFLYFFRSLLL